MGKLAMWLERRYQVHRIRQEADTERVMKNIAHKIGADMKSQHPWANRTSDAEKSLGADVERTQNGAQTTFSMRVGYINEPHVSYGWALEKAHAGVWAIVRPTVQRYKTQVAKEVAQGRKPR